MLDRTPQVFISYSWTSKEYKESVIDLASRMRHDGVDVKLDVWDLLEGQDKYVYMEQCVTNPDIDKVLILSDKVYAEKADKREGGVGDETTIISAEVYNNADQHKFIPVVMERNENGEVYLPAYLKNRIFRDLSGNNYEDEYQELIRTIYDAPLHRRPELGKRPDWLENESPDELYPVENAVKDIKASELGTLKGIAIREFMDVYIEAIKHFYIEDISAETYLKEFRDMKEYRDAFLDHLRAFSETEHFGITMADEFERLYNSLYDIETFKPGARTCRDSDFDIFRLHVWELFICTVTYMLHYEMYKDIHNLLVHTYYLRTSPLGAGGLQPFSYEMLRFYSKVLEERIKPGLQGELSRKFTITGHYIVTEREYLPIYSGKTMANADLFLYQVYNGLGLESLTQYGVWFPVLYVYAEEYDSMWKKLGSKNYCKKVMPIFGADTFDEFKECISKCVPDKDCRYSGGWHGAASAILSWIELDDVATLP